MPLPYRMLAPAFSVCSRALTVCQLVRLSQTYTLEPQVDTVLEGCAFFLERSAYHVVQPTQLSAHLQAAGMTQSHARAFSSVWEAEATGVSLSLAFSFALSLMLSPLCNLCSLSVVLFLLLCIAPSFFFPALTLWPLPRDRTRSLPRVLCCCSHTGTETSKSVVTRHISDIRKCRLAPSYTGRISP